MTTDEFWSIIDTVCRTTPDWRSRDAALWELLRSQSDARLIAFDERYFEQHQRAYRWDLWEAADLLNGGCSDDCFHYFRDWMIAQGRSRFERALDDPDTLAEILTEIGGARLQSFGTVAWHIYVRRTGHLPPDQPRDYKSEPDGDYREDDEGRAHRLPRLTGRQGWSIRRASQGVLTWIGRALRPTVEIDMSWGALVLMQSSDSDGRAITLEAFAAFVASDPDLRRGIPDSQGTNPATGATVRIPGSDTEDYGHFVAAGEVYSLRYENGPERPFISGPSQGGHAQAGNPLRTKFLALARHFGGDFYYTYDDLQTEGLGYGHAWQHPTVAPRRWAEFTQSLSVLLDRALEQGFRFTFELDTDRANIVETDGAIEFVLPRVPNVEISHYEPQYQAPGVNPRPVDPVLVATLCVLGSFTDLIVATDAEPEAWHVGVELARSLWPDLTEPRRIEPTSILNRIP